MFEKEIKVLRFMQGYADQLLADIAPQEMCEQPMPGLNHPAWIIGHLAIAADHHATYAGAEPRLNDWYARFDFGSELSGASGDYPTKDELQSAWHDANERYIAAVSTADAEVMAGPTQGPLAEGLPEVGDFLSFSMTAHTSLHLGQLSAWRRAMGKPRLF